MDIPFRIILAVLLVAFVAHRGYYTHKYEADDPARLSPRKSMLAQRVTTVLIILPPVVLLLYLVVPQWLNWAALSVADGLHWAGLGAGAGRLRAIAVGAERIGPPLERRGPVAG